MQNLTLRIINWLDIFKSRNMHLMYSTFILVSQVCLASPGNSLAFQTNYVSTGNCCVAFSHFSTALKIVSSYYEVSIVTLLKFKSNWN